MTRFNVKSTPRPHKVERNIARSGTSGAIQYRRGAPGVFGLQCAPLKRVYSFSLLVVFILRRAAASAFRFLSLGFS